MFERLCFVSTNCLTCECIMIFMYIRRIVYKTNINMSYNLYVSTFTRILTCNNKLVYSNLHKDFKYLI